VKDIHDVITRAKFGDNRLRGSWVVVGQILAFPIDFAGRPYNTLTLLCERVIITGFSEDESLHVIMNSACDIITGQVLYVLATWQ